MKDEYGQLDSSGLTYSTPIFQLESGVQLQDVQVTWLLTDFSISLLIIVS
jgi:hypothetical protein